MNMKTVVKITGMILCILFFVLPVVQCSQDSSLTATSWQIATKTGKLMSEAKDSYFYIFVLLLIPAALVVIAFLSKSFAVLRNVSIAGLVMKAAFIGVAITRFSKSVSLTPYVWLIIIIYAGLIGLTQYCIIKKKE